MVSCNLDPYLVRLQKALLFTESLHTFASRMKKSHIVITLIYKLHCLYLCIAWIPPTHTSCFHYLTHTLSVFNFLFMCYLSCFVAPHFLLWNNHRAVHASRLQASSYWSLSPQLKPQTVHRRDNANVTSPARLWTLLEPEGMRSRSK